MSYSRTCSKYKIQVRKFFFVSLVFHFIFTMLHTAYVLLVFSWQCKLKVRRFTGYDKTNIAR